MRRLTRLTVLLVALAIVVSGCSAVVGTTPAERRLKVAETLTAFMEQREATADLHDDLYDQYLLDEKDYNAFYDWYEASTPTVDALYLTYQATKGILTAEQNADFARLRREFYVFFLKTHRGGGSQP